MAKEVKKKDSKKDNKKEEKSSKANGTTMSSELKKVTWPTRKELVNSTIAVIVIVILTAIIVFFLDVVFESLSTYGINRLRSVVSNKVNNSVSTTKDADEEVVTDNTTNTTETDGANEDTTNTTTDNTTQEGETGTPTTEE